MHGWGLYTFIEGGMHGAQSLNSYSYSDHHAHYYYTLNLLAVDRSKKEVALMCEILGWVITLHARVALLF